MVGRIAAYLERVPCVFTPHAWSFLPGTPLIWRLSATPIEALLARIGDEVICVSEDELSVARGRHVLPREKGIVIHNGVPDSPLRANPGESCGCARMLMVARFVPQKDHETLVRALANLDEPFELQLVGDGPKESSIASLVRRLKIEDRVIFLGERPDVPQLMARSHLFVLSSNWEGLPLVILEAMRAGLPVVASDVGGLREAVCHGETGYLFRAGDTDQLSGYLARLIEGAELRRQLGVAGRRSYERHFALPRQISETVSVYERLIRRFM
jgi:glycosyltransferase involved in cell wall biosynthesis